MTNDDMTKYGVDTSSPSDSSHRKTASDADRCKICGAKGDRSSGVLLCKTHGSEGFEQR
jgi:hypothetical protein